MMRRLIAVFLLLFLLSGCAAKEAEQSAAPTTENLTTAETTQPGIYQPEHTLEQQTQGAVQVFIPQETDVTRISAIGSNLLLLSGQENVRLTLLAGNKLLPYAQAETTIDLGSELCSYAVLSDGFAYYEPQTNEVVYLNIKLQEDSRILLPEEITGKPHISASGKVYYALADQVREVDPETQIPRMIKKIAGTSLQLTGCAFDGKVLSCTYADGQGTACSVFLSGETGQTLLENEALLSLDTWQDSYFALRMDGIVQQQIFGSLETEPKAFTQPVFAQLLPLNGVLLLESAEEGQTLSVCDLETGKITSQVTLPIKEPTCVLAHSASACIWLLAEDLSGQKTLYRWDYMQTPIETQAVLTGPLYTAQNPDTAGLEECQKRADALNKQYGVRIRIWEEAVKVAEDHILQPEHQVSAINTMLDRIEALMKNFPDGFLRKSDDGTGLRVCIVRQIDDGTDSVQFWDADGDTFLVFSVTSAVEKDFLLMLGYPVISHVMGNAVEMDYWEDWNPAGFVYGEQQDEKYLTGEDRAFADVQSMNSVTDDRSRLFAYAMLEGNEQMFQSAAMQGKLKLLCEAIRDAYRLKRYQEALPWEQYLKEPLVETK